MDKKNIFKKIRRGFTLVELIVVIAIIALLVTLSLIALTNARMASRDSKRMADIKQLQTALELFYDSQDRYPTDAEFQSGSLSYFNANLSTTTYITIPTPPVTADGSCTDAQNAYFYNVSADGSTYTINFCTAKPIDDLPGGKLIAISGGIVAGCYTENDAQFCARQNKNCDSFSGTDNCGNPKTVASCGTCGSGFTCAGSDIPNQCGCASETDSVFCTRLGAVCDSLTGTDNCGHSKTVADCGVAHGTPAPCTLPLTCNGGGVANQCGFTCGTTFTLTTLLGHTCNTGAPDYDTCTYDTIPIGTGTGTSSLCWMKQNMNFGSYIAAVYNGNQTNAQKWCYNNTPNTTCSTSGGLYQWGVAMQSTTTVGAQGICPTGWHIPSEPELYILENYLKDTNATCNAARGNDSGDCSGAGTRLKNGGSSGFNAPLTGGWLNGWSGGIGYFWSSTQNSGTTVEAYMRYLKSQVYVYRRSYGKTNGFSVRCVAPYTSCSVPETDSAFCVRLGANCGTVTRTDNCGQLRTVNCGTCSGYDICGGDGVANQCGFTCGTTVVPATSFPSLDHTCSTLTPYFDACSYNTVSIPISGGTQCWLKQNVNLGLYQAGSTDQIDDSVLQKYCAAGSSGNCLTYGGLYKWDEAMQYGSLSPGAQGICPNGWHIPTDAEQDALDQALNTGTCSNSRIGEGCGNAGSELKEALTTHWYTAATTTPNSSLFTAYGSGQRTTGTTFSALKYNAYFWSSTATGTSAYYRGLTHNFTTVNRNADPKTYGKSVRCVITNPVNH